MQPEKKRKKVLFLITKATQGGAQKYVYDLATNLPTDQFQVHVAYGERGQLSAMLEEHGIAVHVIPSMGRDVKLWSDARSFSDLLSLIHQLRPDVVHLNSSKAAALGALAAFIANVPRIIFTAHGWPFKEQRRRIAKGLIYQISWFTVFLAHATIVVSQKDLEIGKRMPLVGHKIHFVPLGIKAPAFLSREDAWRQIQDIPSIENPLLPRVVTIAELTHNKGIRYGIDAIALLKERNIACNYFVIGSGELREKLEEHAIEKEVETRVHFLGFQEQAARLLKTFDVFLLPSIKEGMPYVLHEAAAAGVPIVATDVIDAAFATSAHAALVPAGKGELLADALERTLNNLVNIDYQAPASLEQMVSETVRRY